MTVHSILILSTRPKKDETATFEDWVIGLRMQRM